jgi:hypothetical protein
MPEDGPIDPISDLAAGAAQIHELFMAYVNADFTRAEALQIIIAMVTKQRPQQ